MQRLLLAVALQVMPLQLLTSDEAFRVDEQPPVEAPFPARRREEIKARLERLQVDDPTVSFDQNGNVFIQEEPFENILQAGGITQEQVSSYVAPEPSSLPTPTSYTPEGVPIHHTLPGATNILYLNFVGETIQGKAWNKENNTAIYRALPYDLDGISGFSKEEQNAISSIWARVAEDYIPWAIDVTTEMPVRSPYAMEVVVTKNLDATGVPMPANSSGGIAYLQVYGFFNNGYYQPGLVYYNNLSGGREDGVAGGVSHESGHLFGLLHDGQGSVGSYFGSGEGESSWSPIMGSGYGKSVTQFSRGEYPNATNTEDDIAMLTELLGLRETTVGSSVSTATPLGTNGVISTNSVIRSAGDVHVYSIKTGGGSLSINASTFRSATNGVGNNLDLALKLKDSANRLLAESNPQTSCSASLKLDNLSGGTYYLEVLSVGNTVTPYSAYGSIGQYTLSGTLGSCRTAAPAITISPLKQSVVAGKTVNYSVAIRNNDSPECSPNAIVLKASAVSGLTATLSGTQVTLAPGATRSVTLQVSSSASLAVGDYLTTVSGTGSTNVSIGSASVIYSVIAAPCVRANPAVTVNPSTTQWVSAGQSATYQVYLTNNDSSNCQSSVFNVTSTASAGVASAINPASVSLAPGAKGVAALKLTTAASLGAGTYTSNIRAVNSVQSSFSGSSQASLGVSPSSGTSKVIYEASMVTRPAGWGITSDPQGVWSFGTPRSTFDPKDSPVVGNFLTGTGLYPEPIAKKVQLASASFSTIGFSDLRLEFDRYLGIEADDRVSILAASQIFGSVLWQNSGAIKDTAWQRITLSLPNLVSDQPLTSIRFEFGPTKSNGTQLTNSYGWNIRKFRITGVPTP